jgi:hypothetical protein
LLVNSHTSPSNSNPAASMVGNARFLSDLPKVRGLFLNQTNQIACVFHSG